jgi:signal transduction histidine kinase
VNVESAVRPLVLIVDDEESGRFVKTAILSRAGFDVRQASSGAEALALIETVPFEAVLLDINLPDMNGVDVCRRIKAKDAVAPVQVLHISATAVTPDDQALGLNSGADGYLAEPVSPAVLVATLRALLRARTAELALAAALQRERAARDEAERANRLKDEFLAALSHELRTPLNAIMGWVWQLRRSPMDEQRRDRALDSVERNTKLQAKLINDLLDVARIGKGKLQLELGTLDLGSVTNEAVDAMRDVASEKDVSLVLDVRTVQVVGDAARLQQIVRNLVSNAIQFTPAGGTITVSVGPEGEHAVLRVQDTGVGIDPDFLPHVFDLFRQAEGGLARQHGGLGLGLALVRQLVELHRGHVTAASAGPGHGTTFTVSLPLAGVTPIIDREAPVPHALSGVHVLVVVDADQEARELLTAVLEAAGASVTPVPSADAALESLRAGSFDVLVSDMEMTESEGLQLLKAAREGGHQMPAVAVTGFATADERQRISEAGYAAHIAKPVVAAGFVRTVAALVRKAS